MTSSDTDIKLLKQIIKEIWEGTPADWNQVREWIDQMQDINAVAKPGDDNLLRDLIFAFDHKMVSRELIYEVVRKGGDVNYEIEGFNCLFNACLYKDLELVTFLLDAGANPNCIQRTLQNHCLIGWNGIIGLKREKGMHGQRSIFQSLIF